MNFEEIENLDTYSKLKILVEKGKKPKKPHPHLRHVSEGKTLTLKDDYSNVFFVISSIEDLMIALERVPEGALLFHMKNGKNDFASWIEKNFGNEILTNKLRKIQINEENPEETRWKLVGALYNEITVLKALSELDPDYL